MVATPPVLPRDGSSQATIVVTARDSSGVPIPNVRLVPSIAPLGTPLTQINQTTTSNGTATFVIIAPTQSTVAVGNQVVLSIAPVEGDFQNAQGRSVSVGLLGLSNATYPEPDFTVAPESPKAGTTVVLDASATKDEQVQCLTCTFTWTIEGKDETGTVVTHVFPAEGAYAVTLTVTDATGTTRSITRAVEIAKAETTTPTTPVTP